MKRICVPAAVVAVAVFFAMTATSRAANLDFTLVNATGVEIEQFNVSPSAEESWQEDVLGENTLPDGGSLKVHFTGEADDCLWDLRVIDGEGTDIVWEEINLCDVSRVKLMFDEGEPVAELE